MSERDRKSELLTDIQTFASNHWVKIVATALAAGVGIGAIHLLPRTIEKYKKIRQNRGLNPDDPHSLLISEILRNMEPDISQEDATAHLQDTLNTLIERHSKKQEIDFASLRGDIITQQEYIDNLVADMRSDQPEIQTDQLRYSSMQGVLRSYHLVKDSIQRIPLNLHENIRAHLQKQLLVEPIEPFDYDKLQIPQIEATETDTWFALKQRSSQNFLRRTPVKGFMRVSQEYFPEDQGADQPEQPHFVVNNIITPTPSENAIAAGLFGAIDQVMRLEAPDAYVRLHPTFSGEESATPFTSESLLGMIPWAEQIATTDSDTELWSIYSESLPKELKDHMAEVPLLANG